MAERDWSIEGDGGEPLHVYARGLDRRVAIRASGPVVLDTDGLAKVIAELTRRLMVLAGRGDLAAMLAEMAYAAERSQADVARSMAAGMSPTAAVHAADKAICKAQRATCGDVYVFHRDRFECALDRDHGGELHSDLRGAQWPVDDPIEAYRAKKTADERIACDHPADDRVPLSGDGWICTLCGADCLAPSVG